MRTTVTLDEDVAVKLRAEARRTGKPFKTILNECVRVALSGEPRSSTPALLPDRTARPRCAQARVVPGQRLGAPGSRGGSRGPVTLIDANVLLYAYHPRALQHERCRTWVEAEFASGAAVRLPWATIVAFLRISTNPRVFERPLTIAHHRRSGSSGFVLACLTVGCARRSGRALLGRSPGPAAPSAGRGPARHRCRPGGAGDRARRHALHDRSRLRALPRVAHAEPSGGVTVGPDGDHRTPQPDAVAAAGPAPAREIGLGKA